MTVRPVFARICPSQDSPRGGWPLPMRRTSLVPPGRLELPTTAFVAQGPLSLGGGVKVDRATLRWGGPATPARACPSDYSDVATGSRHTGADDGARTRVCGLARHCPTNWTTSAKRYALAGTLHGSNPHTMRSVWGFAVALALSALCTGIPAAPSPCLSIRRHSRVASAYTSNLVRATGVEPAYRDNGANDRNRTGLVLGWKPSAIPSRRRSRVFNPSNALSCGNSSRAHRTSQALPLAFLAPSQTPVPN